MDQFDPWQVVLRQVFTPYDCLLISVAVVVLCRVGSLGVPVADMRITKIQCSL